MDAQDEPGWTQPSNLSQSGSSTAPILVKDASGLLYAFWQNALDGYVVSTNRNGEWATPIVTEPPFGTKAFLLDADEDTLIPLFEPTLVGDNEQGIHSLWVNDELVLNHSRIITGNIAALSSWNPPQRIETNVSQVTAAVDNNNFLHIAYLYLGDGASLSPGIYHRFSEDGGFTWSSPTQLYASSYFRQAAEGTVQIDFVRHDDGSLFLIWNDPFSEQVFITGPPSRSEEGYSWSAPQIIDSRREDDGVDAIGPSNIQGVTLSGDIHLFWTAGHDGLQCALYTRSSSNNGEAWSAEVQVTANNERCPEYFDVLQQDDLLLLFTKSGSQASLRIWQNESWSDPVSQPEFVAFADPVSFRNVSAACPYQFEFHNNDLVAVGCGVGTAEDIWVTDRDVAELADSLTFESIWEPQQSLTFSTLSGVQDLQFMSDGSNIHAIWSAEDIASAPDVQASGERKIYYSFWNGDEWIEPSSVLSALEGALQNVHATLTSEGNILVVWDDVDGNLYTSKAGSDQASFFSAWSVPQLLPLELEGARYPHIVEGENSSVYVTYAIPFNENRGIYMIKSEDEGDSWAPNSTFVLDASELAVVGKPDLTISPDGVFNLIALHWPQPTVSDQVAEIYYLRSEDEGLTWTEQVPLEKNFENRSVEALWADIQADSGNNVHRSWQEVQNGEIELWHQNSTDLGLNWGESIRLSTVGQPIGSPAMIIDSSNIPHLFQIVDQATASGSNYLLQHWSYLDNRWISNESHNFYSEPDADSGLSAAVTNNRLLLVGSETDLVLENEPVSGFLFVSQQLEQVDGSLDPNIEVAPVIDPVTNLDSKEEVVEIEITPTVDLQINLSPPDVGNSGGVVGFLNNLGALTGSLILAMLIVLPIVLAVFAVRIFQKRTRGW